MAKKMDRSVLVHVHEDPAWGKASIYAPIHCETANPSLVKLEGGSTASVCLSTTLAAVNGSEQDRSRQIDEAKSTEQFAVDLRQFVSTPGFSGLSHFETSLFATVLEDAITQLRILGECNNEMRVEKVHSDFQLLQALKFGVEQAVVVNELMGINPYDLNRIEYKLNKLEADRNFVTELLVKLYASLSTHGGIGVLTDCIEDIADKERRYTQLIEDEARHRIQKRSLAKQLRQQRNHCKTVQYDSDVQIDALKTAIEDADLIFEITDRYVANWQGARTECHELIIDQKEALSTDSTDYYKRRTEHEQRVHSEVELLTNIIINETLHSVEEWMNKYEQDMEAIDLKIQIKRLEWQTMYDRRVYLDAKYIRHGEEMEAWKTFKVERAKARQYHDDMTKSAITVQAWWRGLLVRKELGPYRPKKKPKGKGKK